jgi:hypothetical protein
MAVLELSFADAGVTHLAMLLFCSLCFFVNKCLKQLFWVTSTGELYNEKWSNRRNNERKLHYLLQSAQVILFTVLENHTKSI